MLEKIESLKDTLQVAIDSGTERIERIHNLVVLYAKQSLRDAKGEEVIDRQSIYDLIRAINRELGEAGTDLIEMIESTQQRLRAEKGEKQ